MLDVKERLKTLYKDAMYFHLIHKGYTMRRAELAVERMFITMNEKIVWAMSKTKNGVSEKMQMDMKRCLKHIKRLCVGLVIILLLVIVQPMFTEVAEADDVTNESYDTMIFTDDRGVEVRSSESLFGNPFMFTGQRYDSDFGLYHFYARSYSPELGGRWLQRDPLGYVDSMNLYEYVSGNPMRFVDPYGFQSKVLINEYIAEIDSAFKDFGNILEVTDADIEDIIRDARFGPRGAATLRSTFKMMQSKAGMLEDIKYARSFLGWTEEEIDDAIIRMTSSARYIDKAKFYAKRAALRVAAKKTAEKTAATKAAAKLGRLAKGILRGTSKVIVPITLAIGFLADPPGSSNEAFARTYNEIAGMGVLGTEFLPTDEQEIVDQMDDIIKNYRGFKSNPHFGPNAGELAEEYKETHLARLEAELEALRAHKTAENQGNSGSGSSSPCSGGGGSAPEFVDVNGNGLD